MAKGGKQMYKLAILDLDGTILDTIGDLASALNHTLETFSLPCITTEKTRSLVGRGLRNLVKDASGSTDEDMISKMHSEMVSYYTAHSMERTVPYPGIPEALHSLKESGVRLAVLSNKKDEVTVALCEHFFPGMFDLCQGEKAGVPIKPSPESVLSVMERLGCSPEDTVYVGDSEVDITTAANAGIDCIIVTWGFRKKEDLEKAGAKVLADDVITMKDLILNF